MKRKKSGPRGLDPVDKRCQCGERLLSNMAKYCPVCSDKIAEERRHKYRGKKGGKKNG